MKWSWWVLLVACRAGEKPAPAVGSGSAVPVVVAPPVVAAPPPAPVVPAWTLETQPIELRGNDDGEPLKLPPPTAGSAMPERALARSAADARCVDLASLATVCTCLVAKEKTKTTCAPVPAAASARAQVVELGIDPADAHSDGTRAYVLVAQHGARWSAVAEVDHSTTIDTDVTPKRGSHEAIDHFETKPVADGTLVWIESESGEDESGGGEHEEQGGATLRICRVPTDAATAPFCYEPIARGQWSYMYETFEPHPKVLVADLALWSAALDSTGALTVKLTAGHDAGRLAGRYHL